MILSFSLSGWLSIFQSRARDSMTHSVRRSVGNTLLFLPFDVIMRPHATCNALALFFLMSLCLYVHFFFLMSLSFSISASLRTSNLLDPIFLSIFKSHDLKLHQILITIFSCFYSFKLLHLNMVLSQDLSGKRQFLCAPFLVTDTRLNTSPVGRLRLSWRVSGLDGCYSKYQICAWIKRVPVNSLKL